ncbi:MAG: hypothetical protein NXH75_00090 [Halobacteriovoraceae bacterium]|nr:hypothetical protein [Halobacteriovoraceae bacterium]
MKKSAVVTLLVLASLPTIAETDYSKCQDYLNPPSTGGVALGGSRIWGLPFTLKEDGSLKVRDGVDLKVEDGGKTEKFNYTVPGFDSGNGVKSDSFVYETVVKRDDKGNILNIFHGPQLTDGKLQELKKQQYKMYLENTSEEIIKKNNEVMGGESGKYVPPFTAFKGTNLDFEVKNGKCVPMRQSQELLGEPKVDGKTASTTNLDTTLCRDVHQFLEANPEAAACFKKDLNMRMSDIFKRHADKYSEEMQNMSQVFPRGTGGYGMGMGMGFGMGMGMGFGGISLTKEVLSNHQPYGRMADDKQYFQTQRRYSYSPILSGHKIVQICFDNGLESSITDNSIWESGSQDSIDANSQSVQAK